MRVRAIIVCLFLLVLSCENQVDIHATGDQIPVAYCILDLDDSIQKISISQSYHPEYQSDKAYGVPSYEVLSGYSAYVERWENEELRETFSFTQAKENQPENSESPYRLVLESSFDVHSGAIYKLRVTDDQAFEVFRGETVTVGSLRVLDPIIVPGRELTLTLDQGYFTRWEPPEYAWVYQTIVYFNYLESDLDEIRPLQVEIPLSVNFSSERIHPISQFMSGRHFYMALRNAIPYVPGVRRKAISLDFEILAGGEELSIYLGKGLSGMSDFGQLKEYSSFDRANGIFSSRLSSWIRGVDLSYITIDSLATGLYTRQLGFISSGEEL